MKNGWKSVLSRQWAHRNLLFILKGNKFKWGEPHPLPHSPQRIPLNVLFRFLITCFDSSYLIAAYFLDYSFSFPLSANFVSSFFNSFLSSFIFSTSYKNRVSSARNKGLSPVNGHTKTFHEWFTVSVTDHSNSESHEANKQFWSQ